MMKIISVSRGFTADHSSTSYEFLAVDRPLTREERNKVSSLSRRCSPGKRRVSFTYHVDGYDIPGGWVPLMESYYDVMYSESYDWWTLAMAFPASDEEKEALERYEFSDVNDLGVQVYPGEKRAVMVIHCRITPGAFFDEDNYGDDAEEEEVECAAGADYLLNLLVKIRSRLMAGDYRALYAVWEVYGMPQGDGEDEADDPPKPPDRKEGGAVVAEFASLLERL